MESIWRYLRRIDAGNETLEMPWDFGRIDGMFLPQFSIKRLLLITAAFAVFSLVVSWGLGGSGWAWGLTAAFIALAIAFLVHAAVFGLLSGLARIFPVAESANRRMSGVRAPGPRISPADQGHRSQLTGIPRQPEN